ncbi:M20 family metallopeptidase [Paenibacillus ihumii]|uniref:M20 family metallopeptidase n=1 Tax=Paenibacillus ihumii TaxID=687436 RepID=UPI0006D767DC|nr:ArgE/DapE family deacylase [Paenibacillus ihumii]
MGQTELIDSVLTAASPGETEQLLMDLIAIESHSDIQDQEEQIACFIRDWLSERGIECMLTEVLPGRPNVIARLTGDGTGPSLVLNGHLDTVPPYGMHSPFKALNKEGKWYGRGSVDMKGALAAMLSALAAIKRSGICLRGDVYFAGTIGEESYSPGAYQLSRSGFTADYAIVGEPTGLRTGIAHKGVAWYEAEFAGRSVHGSVPEQGINAIYRASRWIEHIQDRYLPSLKERSHPLLGSPSLNIGTIEGGTRTVTVPNRCRIGFERRLIPGETAESALMEFQATLVAVKEEHPDFQGEIRIADNFHGVPHGPLQTPPDSPLAAALSSAYEDEFKEEGVSRSDALIGLQFWTDAALLQECCRHTVVCGPGNIEQAHSDDEYIEERQLHAATRIYIRTAAALCAR